MATDQRPDEGLQTGFPQSPSAFDADTRVSFSRLDNKFILESEEGNEFEWDPALKRWIPVVGTQRHMRCLLSQYFLPDCS
jgi:HIV Tat-specific factor 1